MNGCFYVFPAVLIPFFLSCCIGYAKVYKILYDRYIDSFTAAGSTAMLACRRLTSLWVR